MSDKKRFFYVVSNLGNGQITTSAICRIDGTIFNCNELRRQLANENFVHVNNIFVSHWVEFDNEQDYKDFHK